MSSDLDVSMESVDDQSSMMVSTESPLDRRFKKHYNVSTPATTASSPSASLVYLDEESTQTVRKLPLPCLVRPRVHPVYNATRLRKQTTVLRQQPGSSKISRSDPLAESSMSARESNPFLPTPIISPDDDVRYKSTSAQHTAYVSLSRNDTATSDRFIPNRATSNFNFNLWESISKQNQSLNSSFTTTASDNTPSMHDNTISNSSTSNSNNSSAASSSSHGTNTNNSNTTSTAPSSPPQPNLLHTLLRSELLGENHDPLPSVPPLPSNSDGMRGPLREGNRLRYTNPRQLYRQSVYNDSIVNTFSLTPVRSATSQRLMAAPPKRKRRISKVPFKVLDAPQLQDDFYLNLVDWSSQNTLAVALGQCVYLWSACTSKVTKLCDLSATDDTVTSVSWAQRGTHLAVGTNRGEVQLWDTTKCKKIRSMAGHSARVGTLAWTGPILASGSRDRTIYLRDVRVQAPFTDKLVNHKQEVCGLKWSFDEPSFLASGGNDNNLYVIDSRNPATPVHKFSEHTAAVKAIAWSPHQHGLLASGGGTADRCIRFWNTLSGASLNKVDTGSQVCNLAWSQNCNEIVSTHGYSLHQIVVWRYPNMSKVTTLTGHTYRVLYLAMSPDGSTVVTGAGDETLRFWQIFPGPRSDGKDGTGGLLFPNTVGSVIR